MTGASIPAREKDGSCEPPSLRIQGQVKNPFIGTAVAAGVVVDIPAQAQYGGGGVALSCRPGLLVRLDGISPAPVDAEAARTWSPGVIDENPYLCRCKIGRASCRERVCQYV